MSGLKLTITASSIPSIYLRTATSAAATTAPKPTTKPTLRLALWSTNRNMHKERRRIASCAHALSPAHDKAPSKKLGFPFCGHYPSSSSSFSFSSVEKSGSSGCGAGSGSVSSRSGLVTDMGSQSKDRDCSENDVLLRKESPMHDSPESSKLLTLPTILTLGRVAAVPLLVCTFYMDGLWGTAATTSIFITAAITDWLDGYIARKMKLKSTFGAFLDPVADKLMVAATLVLLCTRPLEVTGFGQVPWLLTIPSIAIIGREITMSAVREWAASQDSKLSEAVAVNNLGKWKTATQMMSLTILLATRGSPEGSAFLVGSGVALLYTSAGLAVWSLIVYMKKIWRVLLR
ncbi:hypothetical protein L6164_005584 [Bauhinia variegata]|uniref:Uncharacterized protein n=1 Tax=Bauhinia variegata TaxID=167791 RepID=A0ACB9PQZ0_BAUVA|nr:hypothetical protein L6164_005584 [Bauhinia variegata]